MTTIEQIVEQYLDAFNETDPAERIYQQLLKARPTFRLARERTGMTTRETQARTIPAMLCSGARFDHKSKIES